MGDSMPTVSYADVPRPAPPPPESDLQEWTAYLLALQAPACRVLGSPLYADLLDAAAEDVRRSGPAWGVLEPHATRDDASALALRFMAAVHRLVLLRKAPELALFFPSVGGRAERAGAWDALAGALAEHRDTLVDFVGRPCQTNEVNRCAALVGGFLTVAAETGLPLRVLEIGASGGLNLRWDHYRYADHDGERAWGPTDSPVRLGGQWNLPAALLEQKVDVIERAGCDPRPVDPSSEEGRLSLTASVWGDQPLRFERLRAALSVAAAVPAHVDAAGAGAWLPPRLAHPVPGVATVVFHSVVLQYMDAEERAAVITAIERAGARASADAPLCWLRMEPEQPLRAMSVRLTEWPSGEERLIATAGAHGDPMRWRP